MERAPSRDSSPRGLVGLVLAERYRTEKLLGVGGMGAVYRARHIHIKKTVALKVLHPEMTQFAEVVARFEREAVAAARIDHPNVAAATDFGRLPNGSFYLVLEYVEGQSLRAALAGKRPVDVIRSVQIGKQIAGALHAAHSLGIVHRDLKPENVMLVDKQNEPDFVKVLDFGIAKVSMDEAGSQPVLTRRGAVFGTPHYMSPEQAKGQAVDHRSDLYSLGIILYEMVSGRVPFDSDNAVTVLNAQVGVEPPPLPDDIPSGLALLIMGLLAKPPENRPASAAEVVRVLDGLVLSPGIVCHDRLAIGEHPTVLANLDTALQPASAMVVRSLIGSETTSGMARRYAENLDAILGKVEGLRKRIHVGAREIRAWQALVAVAGVMAGGLFLSAMRPLLSESPPRLTASVSSASRFMASPAVSAWPAPDQSAATPNDVQRVEQIPVFKRKLEDWVGLGRGYAAIGRHRDSVIAYRAALQFDRASRNDPQMLADLKQAAQRDSDAFGLVVNLCEVRRVGLGNAGMNLLWDLWTEFQARPDQQDLAETILKKMVIFVSRASPALRVAVELQVAKDCNQVAVRLVRAAKAADERALPRLKQLELATGCGPDKQEDCFPCLRASDGLSNALATAQRHPSPKIEHGYR